MGDRFLTGIKVIDLGSFVAAPAAATVVADYGADVVKIEPPEGDGYRRLLATAPLNHEGQRPRQSLLTIYRTSDARWIQLSLLNPAREWPLFAEAMEHPEWVADPRYLAPADRLETDETEGPFTRTISNPLHIDGEQKRTPTHAPEIGQHSTAVLRDFGFSDEEIADWLRDGVVVEP